MRGAQALLRMTLNHMTLALIVLKLGISFVYMLIDLASEARNIIWAGNTHRRRRLSTVEHLIKMSCFVKKYIFSINSC